MRLVAIDEMLRSCALETAKNLNIMVEDPEFLTAFADSVNACTVALRAGRKLMFAGNGGSSMDAGHLAAELTGRFRLEGRALRAVSLVDSVASLTAIGNDLGFEFVLSRQVDAIGSSGDILILLSTSGRSANIIEAARAANAMEISVIAWQGAACDTPLSRLANVTVRFPTMDTPRIQELMVVAGHVLCERLEGELRVGGT